MVKRSEILVGLAGNPNTGKSTLFNALTGARQHTGNWPGKTVEKREGNLLHNKTKINIVDLPGAYSLTAYSEEEIITSNFIHEDQPDVIVQILDAQNLERNLFMTLQLIELKAPLVLAVNMTDLADKSGIHINIKQLSILLGIPVVKTDAKRKKGIDELVAAIIKQSSKKIRSHVKLTYGTEVDDELENIRYFIKKNDRKIQDVDLNWISLRLIEGDKRAEQSLSKRPYIHELMFLVEKSVAHLEKIFNKNVHNILATIKYGFIRGLCKDVLVSDLKKNQCNLTDKLDRFLLNRFLGIPIFLLISWLMFQATFSISEPFMGLIETLFGIVGGYVGSILNTIGFSEWMISLIVDGMIGGVGSVLVFAPIIGILFLIMAVLEDSGYMTRVAYVMDKLMHKIGLHGKAFIPMILGFGCNVPGIMATRTLASKKERLLTILINPFMSCGARLPVYALFAGAFFSAHQGLVIFSLYFGGIVIAILIGLIFNKFFSKGLSSPFVIELPPYRLPSVFGVLMHSWEKVWIFIKKAGTIILAFSIIIWALSSLPVGVDYGSEDSLAASIGQTIAPIFEPLGFGNWESSVALIFGFVAKEVVVGTFGTLYGIENIESSEGLENLNNALQGDFTPLSAYAFMIFVLLYVPCMAVLAVVKRETNSWKWPIIMALYTTGIAWLMAFVVYQGGKFLGFN